MPSWLWLRFIARRWGTNPFRIALLVLSVSLATTLWTAVTRVAFSSVETFTDSIGLGDEQFQLRVVAQGGRIDSKELSRALISLPSISDVVFLKREPALISTTSMNAPIVQPSPITLIGVGGIGANPAFAVSETGVSISAAEMRLLGVNTGDLVTLTLEGERKTLRVELLSRRNESLFSRAAVLSPAHFSNLDLVDEVLLALPSGIEQDRVIRDLDTWLNSFAVEPPLRIEAITAPIERAQAVTAAYRFNIFIVAAMSLGVCALLIYQATQLSLLALSREVSILRVLGLSSAELGSALIVEAVIASACGAIVGLVIGYPMTLAITTSLLKTAYDLYGVEFASLSLGDYLLRALVTTLTVTLVGGLSATMATLRAATASASSAARKERTHVRPLPAGLPLRATAMATLLLTTVLATLNAAPGVLVTYLAVGSSLVWVAGVSIGVLALVPVILCRGTLSLSGIVARSLFERSGVSYAFGIMASAVAIALMTSLACMVASFRGTLQDWSRQRLQGDLFVSSAISGEGNESLLGASLVESIRAHPETRRVIAYRETRDMIDGRDILVAGTDVRGQCARGVYSFVSGRCDELLNGASDVTLVSESAARKCNISKGDTVSLHGRSLKVAGILREFGTEQPLFITDEALFTELYKTTGVKTLTIDLRDPSRVEAVRRSLEERHREPIIIRNHGELLKLVEDIFNRTFSVTESVRWIVFVLALAGLVSGYIQHAWERRVDLRVLDVLGKSNVEWLRTLAAEASGLVLVPVTTGGIGGFTLGYILTAFLNPLVFGWELRFELGAHVMAELLGFVVISILCMMGGGMLVVRRVRASVGLRDE